MRRAVEICVSDIGSAIAAGSGGADRIELCADLASGGTTPGAGLIGVAVRRAGVPVHVLIRPRAGDFVFDPVEVEVMLAEIEAARAAGASGLVVGALNRDATIDRATTARLVEASKPLSVTFHKALDLVPDRLVAIDLLVELGVDRVLTAGGLGAARDGVDALRAMVGRAAGRIGVMAGGGIVESDLSALLALTGVCEIHLGSGVTGQAPLAEAFGRGPAPVEAWRVGRVVGLVRRESGD